MKTGQLKIHPVAGMRRLIFSLLVASVTIAALVNLVCSGRGFVFMPDSIGYFGPLADWQSGKGLTAWHGRGFIYPLVLTGLLQDGADYLRVLDAQKLLLGSTLVLAGWMVWRCGTMLDHLPAIRANTAMAVLMLGLASFDFNATQLSLMHTALPETLFTACLALQLCLVWITLHPERQWTPLLGLAGVTWVGLLLILIKPHYLATALVLPLVLALMLRGQRSGRHLLLAILIACIAAAPFHLFDRHQKQTYDPFASTLFAPRTLFCNNLDVVNGAFQRGLDDTLAIRSQIVRILDAGPQGWTAQGFNGDACMYGELRKTIRHHFNGLPDAEFDYYVSTYISAILRAPDMVSTRLVRQLGQLLSSPFYRHIERANDCLALEAMAKRNDFFETLHSRCRMHDAERIDPVDLRPKLFNLVYGLLLAGSLLGLALGRISKAVKQGVLTASCVNTGVASLVAILSYALLVGLVHTFDVFRYIAMISPLFLVSFCCMTVWLFSAGGRVSRPRDQ